MNIIFFGSDDFAAVHLEKLIESKHTISACVTQPDKPKGRGLKLFLSPIKETAGKQDIPVFQPIDIKSADFTTSLKEKSADVFIVIAYGRILSKEILEIPKKVSINVHSSILPKYRGAAPINWAVINGEKKSGITIMMMNEKLDAGDILAQETLKISDADTAHSLREKMMTIGPALLLRTLEEIENDKVRGTPQNEKEATFAPKLVRDTGSIDWSKSALEIHNLVRGLIPWPSAHTLWMGKSLKILETQVVDGNQTDEKPGEIIEVDKDGFQVACREKILLIKAVQLEGAKKMGAYDFALGHNISAGEMLGA